MNDSKFSLDYLTPSVPRAAASSGEPARVPAMNPWDEPVKFYGPPILTSLQVEGRKSVRDLFEITKEKTQASQLTLDEFARVVLEMLNRRQVAVIEKAPAFVDSVIALPIHS